MSLAQALSTYITMNLLIVLGYVGLRIFSFLLRWSGFQIKSAIELKLHYMVLSIAIGLTVFHPFVPGNEIFKPVAKVWSAKSIKTFTAQYKSPDKSGYLSLPMPTGTKTLDANVVSITWLILALFLIGFGVLRMFRDLRSLLRIQRASFSIKRIGRVTIRANDEIKVPFSYWLPGQANVIIPTAVISASKDYRMALAHEIQHHRHGDTKWVYVLWGLKLLCVPNPLIHLWNQWILETQEFACDETLVDQNKVESQAYARCLVKVAQTAIDQKYVPVCATGLTFLVERKILKRRIEKMFTNKSKQIGRSISVAFGVALACIMGATAYASTGLVQDRRITMSQAKVMAEKARHNSDFPVVVNDLVLKQLNRYLGTPEGREFMRMALQRMENYRTLIEGKLKEYGAPAELMAVPIVESGYQNLEQSNNMGWGTGLWMFIAQTARTHGLRVDAQVDERLNVDLLTDAAMRYLGANYLRFKDWHLSTLAYNIGENRVQQAIEKTGSRDAWVLIRNGYENDRDYLPRLMAAILIMRNPNSVE